MPNLKTELKKKLKDATRIAVLGVGSELRCDDVAGLLVAENLKKQLEKRKNPKAKIFIGYTAPENLSGEIIKYKPTHIIIIDSADAGKKAGSIMLINYEEIGGISFSTHKLPLKMMVDYLLQSLKTGIVMIGIQPKTLKFGECISKEVKKSIDQITKTILEII
ncbi:MAG: hydrogenase maturation peptidase HycI [Elusimicrobia bacterium RIFOXYD2_FULL_34_15]|nr:MAG: hydrogenase maturation peptidase HycI [Elusimicrobia bacterium RIFOXYD2_FULL_34_15]